MTGAGAAMPGRPARKVLVMNVVRGSALLLLTVLMLGVLGSAQQPLERDRAAELIRASDSLKEVGEAPVGVGGFCVSASMEPVREKALKASLYRNDQMAPYYLAVSLETSGLTQLARDPSRDGLCPKMTLGYAVTLTRAGKDRFRGMREMESGRSVIYFVPIYTREVVQVGTVLNQAGGSKADVDFTWKFVPTANASLFEATLPLPQDAREGKASLDLSGDGWHVRKVTFEAKN